jgi:probable HAF family extracellular repeat protein
MISLGTLPDGTPDSESWGVSDDGSVVVGGSTLAASGGRAFRWSSAGGMEDLGVLPSAQDSGAYGVSGDGSVEVGTSSGAAFLWDATRGMMDLNAYLPTLGIDLTGWALTFAYAVTADARTIVGEGTHNGHTEAWIATLGPACYANCDRSIAAPILNVNDFQCFLNAFAVGQSLPPDQQVTSYANCDRSISPPVLNVNDFQCFLNAFAAGNGSETP